MKEGLPDFYVDMLNNQYNELDIKRIIDGLNKERKVTCRVNTIKTTMHNIELELNKLNIEYKKVNWYDNAIIIENATKKEIQKLPMYENGEIYLQSLSSMLPPIILNPKPNTDILDMCAAPGGKTTEIAALTNNEAHITACEMKHIRLERLKYNIHKQGATSVYTMQIDARRIDDYFSFDSILLDAPCSGSGIININEDNFEKYFTKKLINKSIASQNELFIKALKILKKGGEMVYSTCSILDVENENNVQNILKTENAEIVPIENLNNLEEIPLLPTKIKGTICICPNELYEGFFIAKIRKK